MTTILLISCSLAGWNNLLCQDAKSTDDHNHLRSESMLGSPAFARQDGDTPCLSCIGRLGATG